MLLLTPATLLAPQYASLLPRRLNAVQSTVWDALSNSDASVACSSPTGSGKTTLFEMAIVRLLRIRDGGVLRRPSPAPRPAPTRAHIIAGVGGGAGAGAGAGGYENEFDYDNEGAYGAFGLNIDEDGGEGEGDEGSGAGAGAGAWGQGQTVAGAAATMGKVIYLAPLRALASERHLDWSTKFASVGLRVAIVTGDENGGDAGVGDDGDIEDANVDGGERRAPPPRHPLDSRLIARVREADIVIATPEKWDAVMRRTSALADFCSSVALLCVDEVHLLGEDRGGVLEALITRMRATILGLRTVAVSATVPNIRDVGAFVGAGPSTCFTFGDAYRPTRLNTFVIGYDGAANPFLFERDLEARVADVVKSYSKNKPTLVFCSTRAGAQSTAEGLARGGGWPPREASVEAEAIAAVAARVSDQALRACLPRGVAFHSAALTPADRAAIERLFASGALAVLASTTTLALGVNLPAHLVIVKSTMAWRGSGEGYKELPHTSILQMIGRAGRPQFDTEGVAVIMTTAARAPALRLLAQGAEPVESTLLTTLVEHLCAELVLETFASFEGATAWLASTFLAKRLTRPGPHRVRYRLAPGASAENVDVFLSRLLADSVFKLQAAGCISVARAASGVWEEWAPRDAAEITATALQCTLMLAPRGPGRILSRAYLRLPTLSLFAELPRDTDVPSALAVLCGAAELSHLIVRRDEKRLLREVAERLGRVRAKGPIVTVPQKAFQLMQLALGRLGTELPGGKAALPFAFKMEGRFVSKELSRIVRAWLAWALCEDVRSPLLPVASALHRALVTQMWEDASPIRLVAQLPGVTDALLPTLAAAGISFGGLAAGEAAGISAAAAAHAARKPLAWGVAVKAAACALMPRLELRVSQNGTSTGVAHLIVDVVEAADYVPDEDVVRFREQPTRQLTLLEALGGAGGAGSAGRRPARQPAAPRHARRDADKEHAFTLAVITADSDDGLVFTARVTGPARFHVTVERPLEGPRLSVHLLHCRALGLDGHVIVEPLYGAGISPLQRRRAVAIRRPPLTIGNGPFIIVDGDDNEDDDEPIPRMPVPRVAPTAPVPRIVLRVTPPPAPATPRITPPAQLTAPVPPRMTPPAVPLPSTPVQSLPPTATTPDTASYIDPFADLDECLASAQAPLVSSPMTMPMPMPRPMPTLPARPPTPPRAVKAQASTKGATKKTTQPSSPPPRADLTGWDKANGSAKTPTSLRVISSWKEGAPEAPVVPKAPRKRSAPAAARAAATKTLRESPPLPSPATSPPQSAVVRFVPDAWVHVPAAAAVTRVTDGDEEDALWREFPSPKASASAPMPLPPQPSSHPASAKSQPLAPLPMPFYSPLPPPPMPIPMPYAYPSPSRSPPPPKPYTASPPPSRSPPSPMPYAASPSPSPLITRLITASSSSASACPSPSPSIARLIAAASASSATAASPYTFGERPAALTALTPFSVPGHSTLTRLLDFGALSGGGSGARPATASTPWPAKGRGVASALASAPLAEADVLAAGFSLYSHPRTTAARPFQPPAPARGPFPPAWLEQPPTNFAPFSGGGREDRKRMRTSEYDGDEESDDGRW